MKKERFLFQDRVGLLICILGFFFWVALLSYKYAYFGYYDWDLAIYDQIAWSLCQGSVSTSLIGWNFLADHAHYIAFLVAPVYYLFPHPLTLIYLELFSFFAGAFVFYKIAKIFLDEWVALTLMVLYIIHPANIFMLFYEFHFESLSIGLIFLLFYFFLKEKFKPFLWTAVLLILIKENMPLIVSMFGIYGLLFKKNKKIEWGLVSLFLGLFFFIATLFIVMPLIRRDLPASNNIYWSLYGQLGDSPLAILQTIFLNPAQVFSIIWTKQNWLYICQLFSSFIFLAPFSPHILMLGGPLILQNLLSGAWQQHTIYFHYAATIVPFVVIAYAHSLAFIKNKIGRFALVGMLTLTIVLSLLNCYRFWNAWQAKVQSWSHPLACIKEDMVQRIPKDAGVVASFDVLSHLSHRKHLYAFYNVWKDINYFTGQSPFILPHQVQYALINFHDPWLQGDLRFNNEFTRERLKKFFTSGHWVEVKKYGSIVLYTRKD